MAIWIDVTRSKRALQRRSRASQMTRLAMVVACACGLFACDSGTVKPTYYSADSIDASVVDDETGAPIGGANVLAAWEMTSGLENHGRAYAMVLEAVTDDKGRVSFPAWGPIAVVERGRVRLGDAPIIKIFKSGYALGGGGNANLMDPAPSHMTSDWDGGTFKLKKFSGTQEEYAGYLDRYLVEWLDQLMGNGCHGVSMPRFLVAVDRQSSVFEQLHTQVSLRDLKYLSDRHANRCGVIAEQVRRRAP